MEEDFESNPERVIAKGYGMHDIFHSVYVFLNYLYSW